METKIFSFTAVTNIGSIKGRIEAPTIQQADQQLINKYPHLRRANVSLLKNQEAARKQPFISYISN